MNVGPLRLVEIISEQMDQIDSEIVFFWFEVLEGRSQFATELRSVLKGVVYELRSGDLFVSANAVQSDVARVLSELRLEILALENVVDRIPVVILSKSPLALPLVSSPADLPEWFPRIGGTSVNIPIVDLSWDASGSLKSPEVDADTISSLLYDFNEIVCRLMRQQDMKDLEPGRRLLQAINEFSDVRKADGLASISRFLDVAEKKHQDTQRIGYRPSSRNVDSAVSLVMRFVSSSTPENLHKKALCLSESIGNPKFNAPTTLLPENLISVLFRPANPPPDISASTMREIMLTVFFCCQLTTGAAHADDYGKFSLRLLESVSRHLVELLEGFNESLAAHDQRYESE